MKAAAMLRLKLVIAVLAAAVTAQAVAAQSGGEKPSSRFLRLVRDAADEPQKLETSIVRYARTASGAEVVVDLVSALHIAEPAYYAELNRRFRDYDAVLYELVAPEGMNAADIAQPSDHPIALVQRAMTSVLELEFQLQAVDYGPKNFVHADMTAEQFAKSMADRGETAMGLFLRALNHALTQESDARTSDWDFWKALFDKDRATAMKRVLAEQFEDMDSSLAAIEGPSGSTLISQRNGVALDVLRRQLAAGRKKIAIFYGAGHMADMARRLEKDFSLTAAGTTWLTAWRMENAPSR